MRGGSPLTVAGAAAELEARFGSFLTAFPFDPQARFAPAGNQSESIMEESRGPRKRLWRLGSQAACSARRSVAIAVAADAELGRGRGVFAAEPDGEAPPPAAHARNVDGEDEQPERHHPEAEHRQEAEQPEEHQQDADQDPEQARARQRQPVAAELHRVARPRIFHHSHQFYRPDLRLHDKWPRSAQNATGGWKAKHSARMMAVCLTSRARREPHAAPRRGEVHRSRLSNPAPPILLFPTLHYRAHLAYMRR